ncbi:MAG: phospholipid carrier-dependent glycosyltransferase [bacterium]|nr:phospholipid carrier-dependent glycosyltransferase [bacterium]
MRNKKSWPWWEAFFLSLIVVFGGWLRFRHLEEPNAYVFDEVYHVPTIKLIMKNDPQAYEWWHGELEEEVESGAYIDWLHPPLAKLITAASLKIFGVQSWAWRAPSAFVGALLIIVGFAFAKTLWPKARWAPLIAALLFATDGVAIAQSRLAMNDIFVTFFITLSVWFYYLYQKKSANNSWLLLTAFTAGLAAATKWSGFLLGLFFLIWEVYRLTQKKTSFAHALKFLSITACAICMIYLLSYWQLFTQHDFGHFLGLEKQVWRYQTRLEAQHPYSAAAWQWPFAWQPIYLYANPQTGEQLWSQPFYPFWYLGLFCLLATAWRTFKDKRKTPSTLFLLGAYLCFWLPWCFSPRIMFLHHYLPALTFVWLLTAKYLDVRAT